MLLPTGVEEENEVTVIDEPESFSTWTSWAAGLLQLCKWVQRGERGHMREMG